MYNITKIILVFLILGCGNLLAQQSEAKPLQTNQLVKPINLSGPRIGCTVLSGKLADKLKEKLDVDPFITQFGWQFETRFFSVESGVSGVLEWILLVGGFEQGVALPSISWLIGMRTAKGIEFGTGPNISAGGLAIVIAGGVTLKSGYLNFPINLAIAPSKNGNRISLIVGFNVRK